ncbi:DUF1631 family protein [Comamonas sp. NLF-1-9]|uniref:DUF1631 family protein n=1 Tax=Comamonas sp. NLF-1-9 TaxID=2853163 RepID=UPI001C439BFD|nr:DUF1631 family protein [Comamonas sp. NLF-1-9]QXL83132.1 DUF1631 family protein [Comamonas sp. NLF-1-9]
MSDSSAGSVAIYRASIVGAVKRASALMADLLQQVRADWPQGAHASALDAQALQLLLKNEVKLITQFPLMMLELFAQGTTTQAGASFAGGKPGQPAKNDVRLRVDMVRVRQSIAAEVGPALSELDTLIGAAQGFDRVQPERNPLRPGNYVRALFAVVYGLGAPAEVSRLWLQRMAPALGPLLAREYLRVSEQLRGRGIQPLHYLSTGRSRFSDLAGDERGAAMRVDVAESFLTPLGQEALPDIDSSMWDSVRPASTLQAPEAGDSAAAPIGVDTPEPTPPPDKRPVSSVQEAARPYNGLAGSAPETLPAEAAAPAAPADAEAAQSPGQTGLQLGDWVEIRAAQGQVRTQLTWLSPRETLFLFTQADGSTQSMTSRMVARLLGSGAMKRAGGAGQ